jgi:predicted ATP-dependent endonuclease of OLD family
MKILKIEIKNYRMLKNFSIDLEEELSLVIGKNNTGKTSILLVLEKFLNSSDKNQFTYDDFNTEFKKELKKLIENENIIPDDNYKELGIKMKIFIKYNEEDNLSNLSRVMMDLNPDNNYIVLGFEFILSYENYLKLRIGYKEFANNEKLKKLQNENYNPKCLNDYIKYKLYGYFKHNKKTYEINKDTMQVNESNFIDLKKENINTHEIISFKYISAKRDVTNKEIDRTLSGQTSRIYKRTESSEDQNKTIGEFKDTLSETDNKLCEIYNTLFSEIIRKVKMFGGIKSNESEINIISTLQHREMLEGNTTVVYNHDEENQLPENYNGLGYLNLISMIFEIEILVKEFGGKKDQKPADINLLFIEEPEAHTHPQMQYIFIKNIKKLLMEGIKKEDGENRDLQFIISTHSSHIVADSDFNDIKYLKKVSTNAVVSKNLKDLEKEYLDNGEIQNFRFLKQYLTLNRAELFFADKAIFIEGDTERILLPAMMKKIDQELPDNPLLSQNISIVEVGNYANIFDKFIDFIGIKKGIIITDIDSYYVEPEYEADGVTQKIYKTTNNPVVVATKCSACDPKAQYTSNNSLIFFYNGEKELSYFKNLTKELKILSKNKKWVSDLTGFLLVTFQTKEMNYYARSFEDSFFHINKEFIINKDNSFPSLTLKWLDKYRDGTIDTYTFSEKAVGSKPSLAIEILLNSKKDELDNEFSNWQIPAYIKEGLIWLKQD